MSESLRKYPFLRKKTWVFFLHIVNIKYTYNMYIDTVFIYVCRYVHIYIFINNIRIYKNHSRSLVFMVVGSWVPCSQSPQVLKSLIWNGAEQCIQSAIQVCGIPTVDWNMCFWPVVGWLCGWLSLQIWNLWIRRADCIVIGKKTPYK